VEILSRGKLYFLFQSTSPKSAIQKRMISGGSEAEVVGFKNVAIYNVDILRRNIRV
jgi:hypothetical protein